jgi:hypothetical protein
MSGPWSKFNVRAAELSSATDALSEVKPELRCPSQECGAIFDVTLGQDDTFEYSLRQASLDCPHCKERNWVPAHAIKDGMTVTCGECEQRALVQYGFTLVPIESEA